MRCPSCGSLDTQVKDSRPTEDSNAIRRRRVCLTCQFRFTTFERVQLRELVVIKRNGRRVPFDRDNLMRSLQIALRKRNVANTLHWVRDGEEALDYLLCRNQYAGRDPSRPPKLVLLDIKMPKVDGIEVLRQIKSSPHLKQVPVVVMTSSNEERDVVESYRLGANSYIVKPVAFDVFLDTVSKVDLYWMLTNRMPA